MKTLFCIFLSIFAFSSVANATADTENFDSEVTAAFSSSTPPTLTDSVAPSILPEDFLSKNLAALAARLSRIKSDVAEVAEEKNLGKRKYKELTTITFPLPDPRGFQSTTRKSEYPTWIEHCDWIERLPPPTPRAGYYESRDRKPGGGYSEYWKKEYDADGNFTGYV